MTRPTPFELVFGAMRERFERVQRELGQGGLDPADRDAFLLDREVATILHELRPDEGFGDATEAAAALLHHAYLFWAGGEVVRRVPHRVLAGLIAEGASRRAVLSRGPSYVQLPPLAIWGLLEGSPPEPLDGWFVRRREDRLEVLAVFGIRPGRDGFTTLEVSGPPPGASSRGGEAPRFEPIQTETGAQAGIGAVTSETELLELCWRIESVA